MRPILKFLDKHLYFIGFVTCLIAVSAGFFFLGRGLESNKRITSENKRAIFVNCTLLANSIIEATKASRGDEATRYYLIAANRALTPTERKRFAAAIKRRQSQGTSGLTIPPCKKIADDPSSVHPVVVATPTTSPTP